MQIYYSKSFKKFKNVGDLLQRYCFFFDIYKKKQKIAPEDAIFPILAFGLTLSQSLHIQHVLRLAYLPRTG